MKKAESLDQEIEVVRNAFWAKYDDAWVKEVFDEYIIANFDGELFQIPYTEEDGEVLFSSRSKWAEVKEEREYIAKSNNLKAISKTEDEFRVANYLCLFGGEDLVGETFTPETEFESSYTKTGQLLVDWEHGFDPEGDGPKRDDILGVVDWKTAKKDKVGLWAERVLARRGEYVEFLETLIEADLIGTSSEAVGSKVVKAKDGTIEIWPLKRDTLTVTPMEPRMMSENTMQAIKALSGLMPNLKALLPEDGVAVSEGADEADTDKSILDKKENEMDEKEVKALKDEAKAELLEEQALQKAAEDQYDADVKAQIAEARKEWESNLPDVKAGGFVMPAVHGKKSDLGDTSDAAYCAYIKTGDLGALKASNATDMNITTAGDGGNAVPTGHYQGIIARRDESLLAKKLGVRNIPGKGTTVNVPLDAEGDGEFIETAESNTFDQDSPALGTVAMTLVKYTKQVNLTQELLQDEDSKLMPFLNDFIGRGIAKTHNSLLLTEVASDGTQWDEFASATAIVFGEPENIVGYDGLDPYLDDSSSVAWVMKSSTHWHIKSIVGTARQYPTPYQMAGDGSSILGYPVHYSAKAGARTAALKPVYFGNWNFVGMREDPGLTVLRDPYSNANKGWVNLHYYFRADYEVLQAEAIGYGQMATA